MPAPLLAGNSLEHMMPTFPRGGVDGVWLFNGYRFLLLFGVDGSWLQVVTGHSKKVKIFRDSFLERKKGGIGIMRKRVDH